MPLVMLRKRRESYPLRETKSECHFKKSSEDQLTILQTAHLFIFIFLNTLLRHALESL